MVTSEERICLWASTDVNSSNAYRDLHWQCIGRVIFMILITKPNPVRFCSGRPKCKQGWRPCYQVFRQVHCNTAETPLYDTLFALDSYVFTPQSRRAWQCKFYSKTPLNEHFLPPNSTAEWCRGLACLLTKRTANISPTASRAGISRCTKA